MEYDERKSHRLSTNTYLSMSDHMRTMADNASSSESRSEFSRLAALYGRLALRTTASACVAPEPPPLAPHKSTMRLPLQDACFQFDRSSVSSHAPSQAGIYALRNKERWIYIGESSDIRIRLLLHLAGDDECITQERPTAFGFELVDDPVERLARQAALIRDLMPVC